MLVKDDNHTTQMDRPTLHVSFLLNRILDLCTYTPMLNLAVIHDFPTSQNNNTRSSAP
jgi:hypothetical protein